MLRKVSTYFFALLILFISSCGNSETTDLSDEIHPGDNIIVNYESSNDQEDIDEYLFIPPSPLQVASIFKKAGLEFDERILCSIEKVDDYTTKFEQALIFGSYSSDLAYCVKNEEYAKASDYLKALRTVGTKIGLETIFNSKDVIERFESNIGNQDSIIDILIFIQENTDDYIEENGKDELSVIYYTGAWIEGMYLGAKTVMENGDKKIGVLISEQMTIAEILLNGLQHIEEQSDDIIDLEESIKEIIDTFYSLESVLSFGENIDYVNVELSDDELTTMSGKIIDLREGIVL